MKLKGKNIPPTQTAFNLQRLSKFPDKRDGLWSSHDHRAMLAGWSRGHHAIPYPKNVTGGKRQAVVHYQDDTFEPWPDDMLKRFDCGTPIEGPIKSGHLTARLDEGKHLGYWPIRVGASGWDKHVRFCITWAKASRLKPIARHNVVVSGVNPEERRILEGGDSVAALDSNVFSAPVSFAPGGSGGSGGAASYAAPAVAPGLAPHLEKMDLTVFNQLRRTGSHAAQIAVAKNSKLKLVRSYTFAERNYPITSAHHLFRWASVIKMLVGMFAATHTDDQVFVDKVHTLLPTVPNSLETNARRALFNELTLADLLWHQSGFQRDRGEDPYPYSDAAFEYGREQLPLLPGDFGGMLVKSKLNFVEEAPNEHEYYNNYNFVAASEVLSRLHSSVRTRFMESIQAFWAQDGASVAARAMAVPVNREACLAAGEVPMRVPPKLHRGTLTGQKAPLVPRGYSVGGDGEFGAAFGYTTMSAAMMVRILQGLCPTTIAPVQRLLHADDLARFLTTSPSATTLDGVPASRGIGAGFSTIAYGGHPNTLRIGHGGDGVVGNSQVYHHIWDEQGVSNHLTFACVMNGPLGDIVSSVGGRVEDIEAAGLWDDDTNLFPKFFQ